MFGGKGGLTWQCLQGEICFRNCEFVFALQEHCLCRSRHDCSRSLGSAQSKVVRVVDKGENKKELKVEEYEIIKENWKFSLEYNAATSACNRSWYIVIMEGQFDDAISQIKAYLFEPTKAGSTFVPTHSTESSRSSWPMLVG
jgi:hypothetical protein